VFNSRRKEIILWFAYEKYETITWLNAKEAIYHIYLTEQKSYGIKKMSKLEEEKNENILKQYFWY